MTNHDPPTCFGILAVAIVLALTLIGLLTVAQWLLPYLPPPFT